MIFIPRKDMAERFIFEQFQENHIEEAYELLDLTYNLNNPIYMNLQMSPQEFKQFTKPSLEDKRHWPISFVVFDKTQGNKMVGLKYLKDMADIQKNPQYFENSARCNLKEFIDYELYKPDLEKDYPHGQMYTSCFWVVHPDLNKSGLGQELYMQGLQICWQKGYRYQGSLTYNRASRHIGEKFGGGLINSLQIDNLELPDGTKPFQNFTDGANYYSASIQNQNILKMGLGNERFEIFKQILNQQQLIKKKQEERQFLKNLTQNKNIFIQPRL